ncbi:MAG: EF-P 5-aminopentanol modification-associated protein YfmH [Acetivibrionales bacterium]|jgi:predicted Zn-dependent peptidase
MVIDKIEYDKAGETLYRYEHSSGLKAFVLPKKGYSKKYAAFAANYGSIDNEFIVPGEKKPTRVPDGIAHFLEHKLFEQEDGNVMDKFSRLGSSPNAYTGFNQTVYHFSCTDRFEDNFRLLLNYVQNPYITEESVEKEKGIIGQEIKMYQDNPGWRAFFNLLGALYSKHPVRTDIAGTIESISKINKDTLYKCYNTFYHPSNMGILAVGDVDPHSVFSMVEASLIKKDAKPEIQRIFPDEPEKINRDYVEQSLAVSMPIFQMGYKDSRLSGDGTDMLMHEVAVKLLLDMLVGRSSALYEQLYEEGLLNATFETDFTIEKGYAFSVLGGESPDPAKVRDRFCQAVGNMRKTGLDADAYERLLKSAIGRHMRKFNSVERISHLFISVHFKGVNVFDYLEVYDKITLKYVNEIFEEHFKPDNLAMSVVRPV